MKTILLVEDNPVNRELIREVLSATEHRVVEACDGEEALQKVETESPDLVLLDIQMPKLDGYGVLERLRNNPRHAGLRVVALTAQAMRGDVEKGLAAGFDAYVTKPIDAVALIQKVEALLASTDAEP